VVVVAPPACAPGIAAALPVAGPLGGAPDGVGLLCQPGYVVPGRPTAGAGAPPGAGDTPGAGPAPRHSEPETAPAWPGGGAAVPPCQPP